MKQNNKIEILAPCGSPDALTAAVRQGADAVYIGLPKFSARAYADNFDEEELRGAVRYCRLHSVKVHTAVNTLVSDNEIALALDAAVSAYEAGVDAFIVQDPGLAMLIKKACPEAQLHASTQMTVHTPEGAAFLYEHGFDRVVLAREMNKQEIAEVVDRCPVDTEVFVHGALCMCVSGQCYLSAMLGGRSGNRGRCAQPCRLPFSVKGGTGYDLSLKDNCIIGRLAELSEMGVTSAKIEGRMKRPEYVAAATAACRTAADSGKADDEQITRLRSVFSRSGFTDGYYNGSLGRAMFGTRSKEDVTAATNKLLSEIRAEYKDEPQKNKVDFIFELCDGKPARLSASSRGKSVVITGSFPEKAVKVALSEEKVRAQLQKTGGTAFFAGNISAEIGEGLTMPISELNAMRRDALVRLTDALSAPPVRKAEDAAPADVIPHKRDGKMRFRAVFPDCDIPEEFKRCELLFVPLFSPCEKIEDLIDRGYRVGVKVPRMIFGREGAVKKALDKVSALGIRDVYCGNIGTAALAVKKGFSVHGGFSLNAFNSETLRFFDEMGLVSVETSIELTTDRINSLGGDITRGIVGYGHLPLMITRNCPNKNGAGCKSCRGVSSITDRRGNRFPLMCDGGCTELLNGDTLIMSDKQGDLRGADFMTLLFTIEPASDRAAILEMYERGENFGGRLTRGLYYRGVE